MHPEDALDVLLSERANNRPDNRLGSAGRAAFPSQMLDEADEALRPLVDAAARLDPLAAAAPSAAFTAELERRLMARMHERAAQPQHSARPLPSTSEAATRPAAAWSSVRRGLSHPAWAGIAAALLLTIGLGVFTAQAAPGQPLYTVRQLAQHMAAQAFPSSTASLKDALARAQVDLVAYDAAIARSDTSTALDKLRALRADDAEAAQLANAISDASARQTASQQVALFRQTASADLRQSLTRLDWQGRAHVTDALRAWGDTSLIASHARILDDTTSSSQGQHGVGKGSTALLQVTGADFADGSQVLVNGQPLGTLIDLSSTSITVRVRTSDLSGGKLVIAVAESDGTVAIAAPIDSSDAGQPGASGTPGTGDHKGDQGDGSAGTSATPNASTTRTPGPDPTESVNPGSSH